MLLNFSRSFDLLKLEKVIKMKLKTRMMLKNINNDYIQEKLKSMIKNNELNDEQIQYIIINTNINEYILQNALPIANAMKKGISIKNIEYIAGLLKDATKQSIFALDNGKGYLYNKVPVIFEHLLSMEDVVNLNKDKYLMVIECFNSSCELKTTEIFEGQKFLDLLTIEKNGKKWINEEYIKGIKAYNEIVKKYFCQNERLIKQPPYIDILLKNGIKIDELADFDFYKLENVLYEILKQQVAIVDIKNCKQIKYENKNYSLIIEKFINTNNIPYLMLENMELKFIDTCVFLYDKKNRKKLFLNKEMEFIIQLFLFIKNEGLTSPNYIFDKEYFNKYYDEFYD